MHGRINRIIFDSDSRGFTLVELIIVIGLLMILAAISAPNISTMMANADFRYDVRMLLGAIKTTRMEAVKRNQLCAITFSTDGAGEDIYTVYVDNDEDLRFTPPGDVALINGTFRNAVINMNSLDNNGDGDPSNAFDGRGLPLNAAGDPGGGTVRLDGSVNPQKTVRSNMTRDVVLNGVGRLKLE